MKKCISVLFIVVMLGIMVLPFAVMSVAKTDVTTEKRNLAAFPEAFDEEGEINLDYLSELGAYFEDRFAFRTAFVNADALMLGKVFGVSTVDTVVVGEEDWLYYTATMDDYLGINTISREKARNILKNVSLVKEYVEKKGGQFVFTIAPDKNEVYKDNMPYYFVTASDENSLSVIKAQMSDYSLNYCDLFEIFDGSDETLYFRRDSHWNNKGALLAYNLMMDSLGIEHENYIGISAKRYQDKVGDLNEMLYPLTAQPEWNYYYDYADRFEYVTDTDSVEDPWIKTQNAESGNGLSLLMFRDSFGNSLLPFFANEFSRAAFSKGLPYKLEAYYEECNPDVVIVEKVERNISDLAEKPPVMTGPMTVLTYTPELAISETTTITIAVSEGDSSFFEVSGRFEEGILSADEELYVRVYQGGERRTYKPFMLSGEDFDNGFVLYLSDDSLSNGHFDLELVAGNENEGKIIKRSGFDVEF